MKIGELLKKGLINRQSIDEDEINGSMASAQRFLERAEVILNDTSFFDVTFTLSYQSMFHAGRCLLFKSGYNERSHFGMIAAIKELYKDDKNLSELIAVLDSYRRTRHAIQYSGELGNELDAIQSIKDAKEFLKLVKKRLKL